MGLYRKKTGRLVTLRCDDDRQWRIQNFEKKEYVGIVYVSAMQWSFIANANNRLYARFVLEKATCGKFPKARGAAVPPPFESATDDRTKRFWLISL